VELGRQPGPGRQPELFFHRGEDVGQRLLGPAEPGRLAQAGELARLGRGHRELDRPETLDFQLQVLGRGRQLDAERGLLVTAQRPGQPLPRRRRHDRYTDEVAALDWIDLSV
jgi:hypothetical protein